MDRRPLETAHIAITWLVVAAFGAIEGLYGKVHYFGDELCYLNVSRAVARADWRAAFDPIWTIGYPALVAGVRSLAPATPEGEWYAITALNWLVFLGSYACLRWLLFEETASMEPRRRARVFDPWVTWLLCCAFLDCELCFHASVSSVLPDLLVAGMFLAASAQTLRFIRRGTPADAVGLGLILGLGCWFKGIFFPYSAIFLFIVALATFLRRPRGSWKPVGMMLVAMGLLAIPYVALLSWAYRGFTLGVTGELNYAFHVNHLPHWTHWVGDAEFGRPLHPNDSIVDGLPVFAFAKPFTTTYSPYNNLAYWDRGFRHFFSLHNQILALVHTGFSFITIVWSHPFLKSFAVLTLCLVVVPIWRDEGRATLRIVWPAVLAALLVVAPYLVVHIEDRYLGISFLVLATVPLLYLLDDALPRRRVFLLGLAAFYVLGVGREMSQYSGKTFLAALRRDDFHRDRDWRLAAELPSYGLKPGDGVALIPSDDVFSSSRCSWAYLSRLRIIAEFGATPWRIVPYDRISLDGDHGEPSDTDGATLFWGLPAARREEVVSAFQRVGSRAIVSLSRPNQADAGWVPIGDTGAWIFRFPGPVPPGA